MITVVLGELCQWTVSFPTPSKIQHTGSKHIVERLDRPLALDVGLGVVRCTKMQLCTQLLMKLPPNLEVKHTSRFETTETSTLCRTTTSQT